MLKKAIRMVIVVSGVFNLIVLVINVYHGIHYVTKSRSGSWDEFDRVLKRNYSNHHLLHLPRCPDVPTQTEWLRKPNVSQISYDALTKKYIFGVDGHFSPHNCVTDERTAVIIPSNHQSVNLRILLNNLIPVLRNQNKDFTIFVVEQAPDAPFNKALLMNACFVEAVRQDVFTCVIFHDVDLIPVTNIVPYRCLKNHPHYISATISDFNSTARGQRLGGVVAMTPQLFKSVNGFSNLYFGNGYEDMDMFQRLRDLNISTVDAQRKDGIFLSRGNEGQGTKSQDEYGLQLLDAASRRAQHEGLKTLKASVQKQKGWRHVFTKFYVKFDAAYYLKQIYTIAKEKSFPLSSIGLEES